MLLELATAPWPTLRGASLVALARIDPEVFVSVAAGLDADPHWSVRAALASALAELPDRRGEARLVAMLSDEDQRVIPSVLNALTATTAPSAKPALIARLSNDDTVVRMAAANGLARLKAVDQVPALVAALDRAAQDGTLRRARGDPGGHGQPRSRSGDARAHSCARGPGLGRARARRGAAAGRRREHRGPALTPAPPPAVPELSAIEALLEPAFTPTAYIDTEKG